MLYQEEIFIPFHLVDAAGILFFSHVFTLSHQVFEQFVIKQLTISWEEWFNNTEWAVPIKHAEANYHFPLVAGTLCNIQLQINEIKTTSFEIRYKFHQNVLNCCTIKTVHVFCSREKKMKMAIPDKIKYQLEKIHTQTF